MKTRIVIPARLASTRLPEKLLRVVGDRSILHHTYDAARRSRLADGVVVAVDDVRLAEEVRRFGGEAFMTGVDCPSGTDRIAEVAAEMPDADVFVNVQGDEPEIDPAVIDLVAALLLDDESADMATAATPIRARERLEDPNCVKVVIGQDRRAITFSRAAIPHVRGGLSEAELSADPPLFWHHVGLYAYRREFLRWFTAAPPGRLEQVEKLEQLRAIESGKRIVVASVPSAPAGIDTPADLDAFSTRLAERESGGSD